MHDHRNSDQMDAESLDVRPFIGGIQQLLACYRSGYTQATGETAQQRAGRYDNEQEFRQFCSVDAGNLAFVVRRIEQEVFDFATKSYMLVKYGSALTDVWERYRRHVVTSLAPINVDQRVEVIEDAICSDNPAEWES